MPRDFSAVFLHRRRGTVRRAAEALLLALLVTVFAPALTPPYADAQEVTGEAAGALAQGDAFMQHRQYEKALDAYRKADKLSHHTSTVCLLRMVRAERRLGNLSAAMDDARKAVKAAGDNKAAAAAAHFVLGTLLADAATKPDDKRLKEAEQEFREALALAPQQTVGHYYLGLTLMRQERDDEGIAEVKKYLAAPDSNEKTLANARRIAANPILAREPLAPDFSLSTLEGGTLTNATLRGTVVLFDFWGTWCEACRNSVSTLRNIRKKYANRPFEIVGINSNDEEADCRAYTARNHMDWKEHLDLSGKVQDIFEVEAFPTYIVLDRDGVIRFRQSGFGPTTGPELEDAIEKALKRPQDPKLAAAASSAPTLERRVPAEPRAGDSAQEQAPPDPVENGEVTGNVYRNQELGLSYQFPAGWAAASPENLRAGNAAAYAAMKARFEKQDQGEGRGAKYVLRRTIFYAAPKAGGDGWHLAIPSVRITAMQTGAEEISPEAVQMNTQLMQRNGFRVVQQPKSFDAGGQRCFRTDFADTSRMPHRWSAQILTAMDGYMLSLEFLAGSPQELEQIAVTAGSLSFSKQ